MIQNLKEEGEEKSTVGLLYIISMKRKRKSKCWAANIIGMIQNLNEELSQ
jgi:hypothetical protein